MPILGLGHIYQANPSGMGSEQASIIREEILTSENFDEFRFDKIKVDELLGVPRCLLNVFQFN